VSGTYAVRVDNPETGEVAAGVSDLSLEDGSKVRRDAQRFPARSL
jgi:hypothetical protein